MPVDDIGQLNRQWGICGFASSLYALYAHNPQQGDSLAQAANTTTRMLAEIKTYLRLLQADELDGLLQEIQVFTRTFGGVFANFTIDTFIDNINAIVTKTDQQLADLRDDQTWGIAMPPHAVVDYLQRVCDFRGARLVQQIPNEAILGLCSGPGMYRGLKHYVYLLGSTVYTWGEQHPNHGQDLFASHGWQIGWAIAIR